MLNMGSWYEMKLMPCYVTCYTLRYFKQRFANSFIIVIHAAFMSLN